MFYLKKKVKIGCVGFACVVVNPTTVVKIIINQCFSVSLFLFFYFFSIENTFVFFLFSLCLAFIHLFSILFSLLFLFIFVFINLFSVFIFLCSYFIITVVYQKVWYHPSVKCNLKL